MLRGSHGSSKEDSGNCSSSAAHLAAFTLMEKCFSGSASITAHTLHTCKVSWEVFVLNINVDMLDGCICGVERKAGRRVAVQSQVAKQLHFSCIELSEIQIKVQLRMTDWGLERVWGGSVGLGGQLLSLLLQCCSAPLLHAFHLHRLASIVETRTIFN